jgi:hypothetical protein
MLFLLNLIAEYFKAFITGSSSPDKNLTIAPPPVQICENPVVLQLVSLR